MLARLALNLTCLVVTLGNSCCEIPVSWNHDESDVGLRSTRNHVFDKVAVPWRIDNGVVPFVCVESAEALCLEACRSLVLN